mgnify:CR=1 FL=1
MSAGEAKYPAAAAAAAVVHPLGSCSACGQAVTTLTGFVNPSCPTAQPMHFACAVCNHCVAHRGKGLFAGATEYQRTAINSLGETLGVVFGFSPAEYDDFLVLPTKTYNVPPMIYSTGRIELLAPLPKPPRRPPPPPPPPPPAAAAATSRIVRSEVTFGLLVTVVI